MDFLNTTSEERFHDRQEIFARADKPRWLHHTWWVIHNVVAHPMIGLLPMKKTFQFHDYTSRKLMNK